MKVSGGKTVSINAIAREIHLAPSTVSRALSGHPAISKATRARVQAHAAQLGYRPNKRLQRFFKTVHHQSYAVAFLVDAAIYDKLHGGSSFYGRIQWAVQAALRHQGLHMLLANSSTDLLADGNLYSAAEGMADGVIVKLNDPDTVRRLAAQVPVVLLYAQLHGVNVDTVTTNIEQAVHWQMDHLRALGHRRIACFRPRPINSGHWQDRRFWNEYAEYGAARGLELPTSYFDPIVFQADRHPAAIHDFLERVFQPGIAPTAILTYDVYAGELIQQLRQRGLDVPTDVSLVGFDDDTHAQFCPIPLTTFRQDFETMASVAVGLLRERMKEPQRPARVVEIAGKLIERASTAPAPSAPRAENLVARA